MDNLPFCGEIYRNEPDCSLGGDTYVPILLVWFYHISQINKMDTLDTQVLTNHPNNKIQFLSSPTHHHAEVLSIPFHIPFCAVQMPLLPPSVWGIHRDQA
jgi:hypothetical protein